MIIRFCPCKRGLCCSVEGFPVRQFKNSRLFYSLRFPVLRTIFMEDLLSGGFALLNPLSSSLKTAGYSYATLSRASHDVRATKPKRATRGKGNVRAGGSYPCKIKKEVFRLPFIAERQGFEPWVPVRVQRFSRPSRSTAPASFLAVATAKVAFFFHSAKKIAAFSYICTS